MEAMRATWAAVIVVTWAGVARAETADLTLRQEPGAAEEEVATGPPDTTPAPWGFYRDRQGRVMQVSFDLGRRVWLGIGYAPHRRLTGQMEVAPAAFDFGASYETCRRTGSRAIACALIEGEARAHSYGLDMTAVRFDLSHRYTTPLLRITTFFGEPARHDFFLNVGLFYGGAPPRARAARDRRRAGADAGQRAGDAGPVAVGDMRSYVRLRAGPGVEMRFGPWADEARYVAFLPQATFEGSLILGKRAFQQIDFRVRGDLLRSASWESRKLPGNWIADARGVVRGRAAGHQRPAGIAAARGRGARARRRRRRGPRRRRHTAGLGVAGHRRLPHVVLRPARSSAARGHAVKPALRSCDRAVGGRRRARRGRGQRRHVRAAGLDHRARTGSVFASASTPASA